jgi:hypothetical protein
VEGDDAETRESLRDRGRRGGGGGGEEEEEEEEEEEVTTKRCWSPTGASSCRTYWASG